MKSYSKGLSGPKKFVLLLSCLAKGGLEKEVSLGEIALEDVPPNRSEVVETFLLRLHAGIVLRLSGGKSIEPHLKKRGYAIPVPLLAREAR